MKAPLPRLLCHRRQPGQGCDLFAAKSAEFRAFDQQGCRRDPAYAGYGCQDVE